MKNKIKRHRAKSKKQRLQLTNHKNLRKRMSLTSSSRFRALLRLTGKIPSMIIIYSPLTAI
jgi:hypothetical protein